MCLRVIDQESVTSLRFYKHWWKLSPEDLSTNSKVALKFIILLFMAPCLRENGYVIPSVLPSEVRHVIKSVKNRTAPAPSRIRSEHLENLSTAPVNTLAGLFTRYLSEFKVPSRDERIIRIRLFV
ncbi:hypothetical protein Y032_0171g333 [Ancylostoma ceylanicum]|uniref:Uncharacterized protein n=1 Tax=Ancylostoma ceylanicum TaxID=53326 RepID=A0A016SVH1_9BILA|nr:hypothetical protein Y032_0171g333 [Ancylostoma ceylanicum]